MTSVQIHEIDPGWELYTDGCPRGETPAQITARAQEFIEMVTLTRADGKVLAFGHGHILRAIAAAWIKAPVATAAGLQLDGATMNILRDGDHGHVIALWNAW